MIFDFSLQYLETDFCDFFRDCVFCGSEGEYWSYKTLDVQAEIKSSYVCNACNLIVDFEGDLLGGRITAKLYLISNNFSNVFILLSNNGINIYKYYEHPSNIIKTISNNPIIDINNINSNIDKYRILI